MLINEQQYKDLPEELKKYFDSEIAGINEEYQKAFYCPKVSRRERHCGHDTTDIPTNPEGMLDHNGGTRYIDGGNKQHNVGNNHPTVKPVALMRYLIQLVTPPNSHIVDPFTGSGTTGMAATELGHRFTGIEQDPAYVEIANKRIEGWLSKEQDTAKAKDNTQPFDRWFERDVDTDQKDAKI